MGISTNLPSERVIQKVARRANADPLDLPPLYFAIDPDALDAAVEGLAEGEIQFQYAGHRVTVHDDGTISLSEGPTSGREDADLVTTET